MKEFNNYQEALTYISSHDVCGDTIKVGNSKYKVNVFNKLEQVFDSKALKVSNSDKIISTGYITEPVNVYAKVNPIDLIEYTGTAKEIEYQKTINKLRSENSDIKMELDYYKGLSEFLKRNFYKYAKQTYDTLSDNDIIDNKSGYDIKKDMYQFCLYLVSKLKNDEFYGVLIRHLLSDHSDFFSDDLKDYKELPKIHKGLVEEREALREIFNMEDK